jgi:hypothetical protein
MDQFRSIGDGLEDLLAAAMGPGVENLVKGPVGGELSQDLRDGDACPGEGRLAAPPHGFVTVPEASMVSVESVGVVGACLTVCAST